MSITKGILITNIISPYRIPLLNQLNTSNKFKLKVLVLSEKEENRQWEFAKDRIKFDYQVLPGFHKFIWSKEIPIHINRGVFRALSSYDSDVIITSGYDVIAYWQAFIYAKITRKKFVLWNGSTLLSSSQTSGIVGHLKSLIIKNADQYITYGTKATEYLEHFGANREQIHTGLNTVDMDKFKDKALNYMDTEEYKHRREKYPRTLLLYVGQLIERKGILKLLKALNDLPNSDIGLLVVGSGPRRKKLEKFVCEHNLDNIYFEGFQRREKLYRYYSLADVFVLPSLEEVWGLVVNEALASGLFVLASNKAGSSFDLIRSDWNGKSFNPQDEDALKELIELANTNIKDIRTRRIEISEDAIESFNLDHSVEAFMKAIETTMPK